MQDLIKKEKKLFSTLQYNLLNDFIRIDKSFIPNLVSNKLNRFYSEENSFWFARLKIKDTKTIYYFGSDDDNENLIKPDLILNFNAESKFSPIKFFKDTVAIRAKLKNNNETYAKQLSRNFDIRKNKDFYFFILGEIESREIINNIKIFTELIDYDINFEDNYLMINDPIIENFNNLSQEFFILKNNVEIYNIIEVMKETIGNQKIIDEIVNFLFVEDKNHNFTLNKNLFRYNLPISKYFNFILNYLQDFDKYLELEDADAINSFKQNFNEVISNFENILLNQSTSGNEVENYNTELLNNYLNLLETPKVKFLLIPSYGLDDEDLSQISKNIEIDISKGVITDEDDSDLIIENYFKNYLSTINSNEVFKYFEEYVAGTLFKELLNKYDELNQEDVEDIKNKIKFDIENENLNEDDINKRFEVYFSKKSLEIEYIYKLSIQNHSKYTVHGLNRNEINEIFDEVSEKIKNWHKDWTIFNESLQQAIDAVVDKKLRDIRTNSNQKFEELFPNKKSVKDVLNKSILSENEYKQLTDKIYKDIFNLVIRSNDICDELIIEYYNKYVD